MTNEEKEKVIRLWIDPAERITLRFLDEQGLSAEVTSCNDASVALSIETRVPYMNQHTSIPLRQIEVTEDLAHYTRDPDRPLKRRRLMLTINEKRPRIIY